MSVLKHQWKWHSGCVTPCAATVGTAKGWLFPVKLAGPAPTPSSSLSDSRKNEAKPKQRVNELPCTRAWPVAPVRQLQLLNKCNLTAGLCPRSSFVHWSAWVFFWHGAGILQAKATKHSLAENDYLRWTGHWGYPDTCCAADEKAKLLLFTPGYIQGLIQFPKDKCVLSLEISLDTWDTHRIIEW